jgi:hypothetical protein
MALSNISGNLICDVILTALHPTSGTTTLGSLTITFPIRIALLSAAGSQTAAGTQISGGSYVAVASGAGGISIGANWGAAASASQAINATVSQTNMPAVTTTSIELWDSNATNKRLEFGNLTASKTTTAGDTLSFASAAITSAIS